MKILTLEDLLNTLTPAGRVKSNNEEQNSNSTVNEFPSSVLLSENLFPPEEDFDMMEEITTATTEDRTNGIAPDSMDEAIIIKIMKTTLQIGQNEEAQFAAGLDEAEHTAESSNCKQPNTPEINESTQRNDLSPIPASQLTIANEVEVREQSMNEAEYLEDEATTSEIKGEFKEEEDREWEEIIQARNKGKYWNEEGALKKLC